ncbi:MAG: hypothetical protein H0W72_00610 [Planctomycetes bacterium]|nr:hypothetical protein [Planctomycetota bacterium]
MAMAMVLVQVLTQQLDFGLGLEREHAPQIHPTDRELDGPIGRHALVESSVSWHIVIAGIFVDRGEPRVGPGTVHLAIVQICRKCALVIRTVKTACDIT